MMSEVCRNWAFIWHGTAASRGHSMHFPMPVYLTLPLCIPGPQAGQPDALIAFIYFCDALPVAW